MTRQFVADRVRSVFNLPSFMQGISKKDLLRTPVQHIDITTFDSTIIVEQYKHMAFQARNLARAAQIYVDMLSDTTCSIILCLAGSLFSAGLKKVVFDLVKYNMVDAIVSTGANIVDQDFFESLGFKHYQGSPQASDEMLLEHNIDRIYDTYIDEEELRYCDMTVSKIADLLTPEAYSSREFIIAMGRYLKEKGLGADSIVRQAYEKELPIFVPAFSDCSAGLGLIHHQWNRKDGKNVKIDSVKDFLELTQMKLSSGVTGLFMIGGGVPKNFAQDATIGAEIISNKKVDMHKYAIQITVADERDGALSGSTLKEAHSWGKVDTEFEQMVFAEATLALPLIASYAYHSKAWQGRKQKGYNSILKGK